MKFQMWNESQCFIVSWNDTAGDKINKLNQFQLNKFQENVQNLQQKIPLFSNIVHVFINIALPTQKIFFVVITLSYMVPLLTTFISSWIIPLKHLFSQNKKRKTYAKRSYYSAFHHSNSKSTHTYAAHIYYEYYEYSLQ